MKKLCVAVFLGVCLLFTLGCSSTPPGTNKIGDLVKKGSEMIGQNVVVIGTSEIRTPMSSFNMFRVYDGGDNMWVAFPDTVSMPPQGVKIRVTGALQKKKFTGMSEEQLYIEATSVNME